MEDIKYKINEYSEPVEIINNEFESNKASNDIIIKQALAEHERRLKLDNEKDASF